MSDSENKVFFHSDLTEFQKEKISELRTSIANDLKKYPEYNTDFSLQRWLEDWNYKIDVIIPKLKWALSVFNNLGLNELKIDSVVDIHNFFTTNNPAVDYVPGGIMSQDKDGNVIYFQTPSRAHPRTLIKTESNSKLLVTQIIMLEFAFKLIRTYEEKHKRKCGLKVIMDLENFSYNDLIFMPAIKEYLKLLALVQQLFPDLLVKVWLVHPPTSVSVLFNIAKPVLSRKVIDKVEICGKDWQNVLVKSCGSENLYTTLGGTKPFDFPYGRIGGKVPENLWYTAELFPFDDANKMIAIAIPANEKHEVRFTANKNDVIRWLFRVNNGEINFSICCNGNEVYPNFRLSTEFVPEKGQMTAKCTGEYVAIFDNTHTKLWKKEIKFRIEKDLNEIETERM